MLGGWLDGMDEEDEEKDAPSRKFKRKKSMVRF